MPQMILKLPCLLGEVDFVSPRMSNMSFAFQRKCAIHCCGGFFLWFRQPLNVAEGTFLFTLLKDFGHWALTASECGLHLQRICYVSRACSHLYLCFGVGSLRADCRTSCEQSTCNIIWRYWPLLFLRPLPPSNTFRLLRNMVARDVRPHACKFTPPTGSTCGEKKLDRD